MRVLTLEEMERVAGGTGKPKSGATPKGGHGGAHSGSASGSGGGGSGSGSSNSSSSGGIVTTPPPTGT